MKNSMFTESLSNSLPGPRVCLRGKASSAKQHLEEASSSIPNNIAEGNGKWSKRDRKRFFEIARGSALECASCLDILVARQRVDRNHIAAGKEKLHSVVNLLTRMIKNLSKGDSYE